MTLQSRACFPRTEKGFTARNAEQCSKFVLRRRSARDTMCQMKVFPFRVCLRFAEQDVVHITVRV